MYLRGDRQFSPDDEVSLLAQGWHAPGPICVDFYWFWEYFSWPASGNASLTATKVLIDAIEQHPAPVGEPATCRRVHYGALSGKSALMN